MRGREIYIRVTGGGGLRGWVKREREREKERERKREREEEISTKSIALFCFL